MSAVHRIDLVHLGLEGAIASYLVEGTETVLVDPGPATTVDRLVAELERLGVGPRDLRHVALTHVHLDHAGGTGDLLRAFPRAQVHVHADGAPHMADPERLVASTRRTFGGAHDRLWGETRAVPADRIRAWRAWEAHEVGGLRPIPTPGHIAHHLAYLDERDGTLLAGDAMGIVLDPRAPTHPPTPPPGVDVPAWRHTLAELRGVGPERFGAAHFGFHAGVDDRIDQLEEGLGALEDRVLEAMGRGDEGDAERFEAEVRDAQAPTVGRERTDRYFDTFPAATDWAGMRLHLRRRADS